MLFLHNNAIDTQGRRENSEASGAKEVDEAPCERSKQKIFSFQKLALEKHCWFTL